MKIGIIGDVHWCQYSSIVRKRGKKYSLRLENCINSINWAEQTTKNCGCEFNIYLGDFFDKPDLNSEEISALKEIKWNDLHKYFLVGNHEASRGDLSLNSTNVFELLQNFTYSNNKLFSVIDKPTLLEADMDTSIYFLPYILEENRLPFNNYFDTLNNNKKILFSHNDIKGLQLGNFISQQGFSIEEIENIFDLCFNGHLHNGGQISNKIFNVGNLTGQNFSENANEYSHNIYILDTDKLFCYAITNVFAFNFYKEDWTKKVPDINIFNANSVITVQTSEKTYEQAKMFIDNNKNIVESRVILKPSISGVQEETFEDLSIDHYRAFKEYILANIDANQLTQEEISYILQ